MYAWIDLETTGLDPETCSILEFGICFTDECGVKIPLDMILLGEKDSHRYPGIFTIRDAVASVVLRPPENLHQIAPEVAEMHLKSGLIADVFKSEVSTQSVGIAVNALLWLVRGKYRIAGNSVHFDARFLRKHMPGVMEMLHYRQLDVSAVAMFAEGLGIPRPERTGGPAHRVTEDIEDSIAMFRYYRERLGPRTLEAV